MMRVFALLLAGVLLLGAFLLNTFYTDLRTRLVSPSDRFFLVSWDAPSNIRDKFIDVYAKNLISPSRTERKLDREYTDALSSHFDKYCKMVGNLRDWTRVCTREFSFSGSKWQTRIIPGVTYEDGLAKAKTALSRVNLKQGFAPSFNTSDSSEISQAAMARAFWFGLILPLALLALSISSVIFVALRKR